MSFSLLLHNIGFAGGGVIAILFAFFVYLKDRKKSVNITFALAFISIAIFCISHVIGVNIKDPYISRNVLMWNISVIWIAVFLTHCSFALVNAVKKQKLFMYGMYGAAFVLTIIYVLYPDTYLLASSPKLYFVNYYNPGNLQWIMRIIFDIIVPVYFLGYLVYAYQSADLNIRNRLKYFFVALFIGYSLGSLAIPLVYDIPIDPLWAAPFVPILAIPMAYAIIRYNLLDIRVIARQAFIFAVVVTISSLGIFFVGYINSLIEVQFVDFPTWVLPILASCVAATLGLITWKRFKETDILKYKFITIMTHKLRTPLTSIKWSVENLNNIIPASGTSDLEHINESADQLIELANVLEEISAEDQVHYTYEYETIDIVELIRNIEGKYRSFAKNKQIFFMSDINNLKPIYVRADKSKLHLVIESLMDNAIRYTKKGGRVTVLLLKTNGVVSVVVEDTGIGFTHEEYRLLFTRMYRTEAAQKTDTEGSGVGLFIGKKIVEHHGGKLTAFSEGKNKGSIFTLALPLWKA